MKKALIPILLSFILLSGSVGIAEAAALTQQQINAIIGLLRSFGADEGVVANVNATLGGTGASGGTTTAWCYTFNNDLRFGDGGSQNVYLENDVQNLQTALEREGFKINDSEKKGGAVFGEFTAAAVTGFQEKYRDEILAPLGLKYGTGYVGKSTRAKLNQLYGCGGVTKSPVSAGYLEIEPSSASLVVGESVSMQAMYQPPMPKCSEGFACPQVMPARYPVVAEWTSSNPSVASIIGVAVGDCFTTRCQSFYSAEIKGVSNGTADIKAAYKSPSGTFLTATAKITVGSGLVVPSITVTSPNGGEVWQVGTKQLIKWSASPSITNVIIGLKTWSPSCEKSPCPLYPVSLYNIANNVSNTGVYEWVVGAGEGVVPKIPDGKYIVTVGDIRGIVDSTAASDSSDAPFSIVAAGTTVYESVKCVFSGSTSDQNCYTATDTSSSYYKLGCSGVGACVVNLKGIKGDKITWKSSCGGYAYTVMDGTNKYAEFNCSSASPSITVTSPNGGEVWQVGSTQIIRWSGGNSTDRIGVTRIAAPGTSLPSRDIVILNSNSGSYSWAIPTGEALGNYLMRVCTLAGENDCVNTDQSNAPFSIVGGVAEKLPDLTFSKLEVGVIENGNFVAKPQPVAGERYALRAQVSNVGSASFDDNISFSWSIPSSNSGSKYYAMTLGVGQSQSILLPYSEGLVSVAGSYTAQITVDFLNQIKELSENNNSATVQFTVAPKSAPITVTSPNGGETWTRNTTQTLNWLISQSYASILIHLISADGTRPYTIASIGGGTSGYGWNVGQVTDSVVPPDGQYRIRVSGLNTTGNVVAYDESDAPFSIVAAGTQPSITVLSPNGGETWAMGESQTIKWSGSNGTRVNVTLLNTDKSKEVYGLAMAVLNDGSELIKVPYDLPAGQYYLRVSCVENCSPWPSFDDGNAPFSIVAVATPSITITYPNGGEALIKGQSYFIKWAQTGFASDGWIQLQLRDAANSSAMVKLITSSVPLGTYAGSFNWTVPTDIPDGKYLLWATAGSGLDSLGTRVLGSDFSNSPFSISVSPAGAADASSGGDSSFAALLFSLERQLEELERILNSLLP